MPKYVLRAALLVDPGTGTCVKDGAVFVDADCIKNSGPFEEIVSLVPEGTRVYDLGCGALLPGLFNSHVHSTMPGDGSLVESASRYPPEVLALRAASNLIKEMRCGVTTVVDVGSPWGVMKALKAFIEEESEPYPTLLAAGPPVTITGGHCWPWGGEADDCTQIKTLCRSLLKEGADLIKMMGNGGGTARTNRLVPAYRTLELAAGVEAAHWFKKPVFIHANVTEAIRRAVDAGIDVICHCTFMNPDGSASHDAQLLDKFAHKGVYANLTLQSARCHIDWLQQKMPLDSQVRSDLDRSLKYYDWQIQNCRKLYECGIRQIAGSDVGWELSAFGSFTLNLELVDMARAGVPAIEVLKSATDTPARLFGMAAGSLSAGNKADIVYVDGNPLQDMNAITKVNLVVKAGLVAHDPLSLMQEPADIRCQ